MEKSAHEAFEKQGESEKAVRRTVAASRSGRLIKFPAASLARKPRLKASWLPFFFLTYSAWQKSCEGLSQKRSKTMLATKKKSILVKLLPPQMSTLTSLARTDLHLLQHLPRKVALWFRLGKQNAN